MQFNYYNIHSTNYLNITPQIHTIYHSMKPNQYYQNSFKVPQYLYLQGNLQLHLDKRLDIEDKRLDIELKLIERTITQKEIQLKRLDVEVNSSKITLINTALDMLKHTNNPEQTKLLILFLNNVTNISEIKEITNKYKEETEIFGVLNLKDKNILRYLLQKLKFQQSKYLEDQSQQQDQKHKYSLKEQQKIGFQKDKLKIKRITKEKPRKIIQPHEKQQLLRIFQQHPNLGARSIQKKLKQKKIQISLSTISTQLKIQKELLRREKMKRGQKEKIKDWQNLENSN